MRVRKEREAAKLMLAQMARVEQLNQANAAATVVGYWGNASPPAGITLGRWKGMVKRITSDHLKHGIKNLQSRA